MRGLNRNKQVLWYALYIGKTEIIDEYGNRTGQFTLHYDNPTMARANISPAGGETSITQFGEDERYDKVIVFASVDIPIDEYSVIWIDSEPAIDKKGALVVNPETGEAITPHDYVVKRVARSLNSTAYAVNKVNVRA